jgi:hypothetical protein
LRLLYPSIRPPSRTIPHIIATPSGPGCSGLIAAGPKLFVGASGCSIRVRVFPIGPRWRRVSDGAIWLVKPDTPGRCSRESGLCLVPSRFVVDAADLIEVLESLFPGLEPLGEAEPGRTKQPTDAARELVTLALDRPGILATSEWSDPLVLIEVLLDKGAEPPWDHFAWSFVEDLLNAVSHGDLPVTREQVNEALGPASRTLADYLDRVWVSLPDDEAPNVMDQSKFDSIGNPDLRWMIRCMFRRTSAGAYIGIADIVRREAKTGKPGGLVE